MSAVAAPDAPAAAAPPTEPEIIARLQQTVSPSRLTLFLQCRLKFWFRYVARPTKPKSAALHVGGSDHAVLKAWNKSRWRKEPLTLKQLHDEYAKRRTSPFNIYAPQRANFCRVDLIHQGYEVNVFRQEVYLPFLRLTNSYNASRALRFDIGYCRKLCLNGVIFESEAIDFRVPHSRERIGETLSFKLGKERMEAVRKKFGAQAERLLSHSIENGVAVPLFFKAMNLPLPKSPDDYRDRAAELFKPLKKTAESLVKTDKDEMGANAYALFNALTDFASRPPGLRDFLRAEHSMQTQAGRWLREFDELLQKNPKPNLTEYLGEYSKVADWN